MYSSKEKINLLTVTYDLAFDTPSRYENGKTGGSTSFAVGFSRFCIPFSRRPYRLPFSPPPITWSFGEDGAICNYRLIQFFCKERTELSDDLDLICWPGRGRVGPAIAKRQPLLDDRFFSNKIQIQWGCRSPKSIRSQEPSIRLKYKQHQSINCQSNTDLQRTNLFRFFDIFIHFFPPWYWF